MRGALAAEIPWEKRGVSGGVMERAEKACQLFRSVEPQPSTAIGASFGDGNVFSVLTGLLCIRNISFVNDNGNKPASGESGLYNRIAVLRAERGISRQDLADAVGVNYQTIGFLERGDYGPSLKLAFAVASFFGLPIEAVFSTEPFRPLSEQVYGAFPAKAGNDKAGGSQ